MSEPEARGPEDDEAIQSESAPNPVAGAISRLAERATVEVDDASVADRVAGLRQDAAAAWRDPAYLQKLGRTAVEELRYQGERRGWEEVETEARARGGLSDLYAGAVEAAMGSDLDHAARLYDHVREVIAPERQATLDRRFVDAREGALLREIDGALATLPLDPKGPPEAQVFDTRTEGLIPDDASPGLHTRIGQVAAHAQRRAERQWQKQQAEAGVTALDWLRRNPDASLAGLPWDVRDWLAPDQWDGLVDAATNGRVRTDPSVYERLDRQAVYQPKQFASIDLSRHRLALGDDDYARLAAAQQARAEGRTDLAQIRWAHTRIGIDRALEAHGIDTGSPEAIAVRVDAHGWLDDFEAIEGRLPRSADLDEMVSRAVEPLAPDPDGTAPAELEMPPQETTADDARTISGEDDPSEQRPELAGSSPEEGSVPAVEAASVPIADTGQTDDGPPPAFATDPNIIRVAGGNNSSRRGGGRDVTPTEQIRAANFQSTLNAIRALEPNNRELSYIAPRGWVPSQSDIARVQEELLRAKARAAGETSAIPIGPYARESIPARSAERNFTAEERREVDRTGNQYGCHTCGTIVPGSKLGHWVPDHQIPSRLNRSGEPQRPYPQCLSCSARQGGQVVQQQRREKEDK